jgi:hypothetical protein
MIWKFYLLTLLNLENELRETGTWMRRLTGYDPATSHAEPGWAVEMGFEAACDLGRRFKQDAIFWVSGKRVWVVKSASDRQRTKISPFAYRFAVEEAHALEGFSFRGSIAAMSPRIQSKAIRTAESCQPTNP